MAPLGLLVRVREPAGVLLDLAVYGPEEGALDLLGDRPAIPRADPAIVDFKNPFFSDAPVGQIFSDTAKNLTPQYLGKKGGPVRVAVENVLRKVEQGKTSGAAAWSEAVKEAQKAAAS